LSSVVNSFDYIIFREDVIIITKAPNARLWKWSSRVSDNPYKIRILPLECPIFPPETMSNPRLNTMYTHTRFIYRYFILTSSRAQITTFIASQRKLCGHRVFFTTRKPYAIIRIGIICILYYVSKPNNAARDGYKILSCMRSHYLRTITDATLCYKTAIYKTGRLVLRSVHNLNKFRFDNVAQRKRQ